MVIRRKKKLKLIKKWYGYIVVNTKNRTHAHFNDLQGAHACIELFYKKPECVPRSAYMQEALRRLRDSE